MDVNFKSRGNSKIKAKLDDLLSKFGYFTVRIYCNRKNCQNEKSFTFKNIATP